MSGCDTAPRPFVLRRESFGGILFDPEDGTHVEVDESAYDFLGEWLGSRRPPRTDDERAFLESLCAEVPSLGERSRGCRIVADRSRDLPSFRHATVLGSPSLVDLQLTTRCRMGCPHCYASSSVDGADMPFEAVVHVLDEIAEAGVLQLALGGGEPLLYPRIVDVLRAARERGLVPNLTTTGDGLSQEVLDAFAECCGAVAVSLEEIHEAFDRRRKSGFDFFESTHARLRARGISSVFQVTLSVENVPSLPSIVDYCLSVPDLYGVIFLAYKPAGRGRGYQTPLSGMSSSALFPTLRSAFLRLAAHTRVGYDCCLTPGIVGMEEELGNGAAGMLEGCSAVRKSVGISTNLDVVPCTFLTHRPLGNLREQTFLEIWRGERANAFRSAMDRTVEERPACRACRWRDGCLGGCPEWNLVACKGPTTTE